MRAAEIRRAGDRAMGCNFSVMGLWLWSITEADDFKKICLSGKASRETSLEALIGFRWDAVRWAATYAFLRTKVIQISAESTKNPLKIVNADNNSQKKVKDAPKRADESGFGTPAQWFWGDVGGRRKSQKWCRSYGGKEKKMYICGGQIHNYL